MFPLHNEIRALPSTAEATHEASSILAELQKAHARVIASVRELTKVTGTPRVDKLACVTARFRVSEANLARRFIFQKAVDFLFSRASLANQQLLSRLRTADAHLAQHSSRDISRWTTDKLLFEWDDYCCASNKLRGEILKQIELERTQLYPLLHKAGTPRRREEFRFIPIEEFLGGEVAAV